MERKPLESVEQFIKRTDFMPKLRAALETIEQSEMYNVFERLQRGSCLVQITFNGETVEINSAEVIVPSELKPSLPEVNVEIRDKAPDEVKGKKGKTK
jgi:hypothetical protein